MSDTITESTWLSANPRKVSTTNAGEAVILDPVTSRYYGLKGVGERVWALLQSPVRLPDLRDAVVAAYEVSPEEAQRDIHDLLVQLFDADLIEAREES